MDFKIYEISVIPLIIFLTKIVVNLGIPKKFSPLISLALGIAVGIAYFSPGNIFKGIMIGVFLAASSVGFYSSSKNLYEELKIRRLKRK